MASPNPSAPHRRPLAWALRLGAACLALALLGACGKDDAPADAADEAAAERDVDVERDGDRIVIKTDGDESLQMSAGEALPLPTDFPKDVYLPEAYRVNSVMDMGNMRVVSVMAQGQVSTLFAEARAAMERDGWKQTMAMQHSASNAMLSFEKAERNAVLSFNRTQSGPDGVVISVQLRQDKR